MRRRYLLFGAMAAVALAVACGDSGTGPASPTGPSPTAGGSTANPDGSNLKVTAPTPVSPANGSTLDYSTPALVVQAATGKFVTAQVQHRFEVRDEGNTLVVNRLQPATSLTLPSLDPNRTYRWRVRGEIADGFGPWSAEWTFKTPDKPQSYIRGNEVYDALTEGTTVGTVSGPVQWIPGVGVKLMDFTSRITYQLPETLQDGEYSMLVTGIDDGSRGDKSKVMSMQEGYGDIITNDYRFTVEFRGRDYYLPGTLSWRIITGGGEEPYDMPRVQVNISDTDLNLWRVTWRTGSATFEIRRGGADGPMVFTHTMGTGSHPYRPVPHVVHVGAPIGRSGAAAATVPGMIVRGVWVSPNPRPAYADQ